jgi:chorismate-pyruvate lyase
MREWPIERGLLYPLSEFAPGVAGTQVPGVDLPDPQRSLLVHERDMTPTLEGFHKERIHLHLLEKRQEGDTFYRLVVLTTDDTEKAVEYGAIAIHLELFPERARELITGCHVPLGSILARESIPHASCPQGFFRLEAERRISDALRLPGPATLYGRRSALRTLEGRVLADVVEILPP